MVSSRVGAVLAFALAQTSLGSYYPPYEADKVFYGYKSFKEIPEDVLHPPEMACDPCKGCNKPCDWWTDEKGGAADCARPFQEAYLKYCGFYDGSEPTPMRDVCPLQCNKPKKCKKFCHVMRRDKACRYQPRSCSGCDWCEWQGKGFVPAHKTCPRWCLKYAFTGKSPAVNPMEEPGCYIMEACSGCKECNWEKVVTTALEAQKDPEMAKDILDKWSCPMWCVENHKPRNLCKYPHCKSCPSCDLDRRLSESNVTAIEVPYVSV